MELETHTQNNYKNHHPQYLQGKLLKQRPRDLTKTSFQTGTRFSNTLPKQTQISLLHNTNHHNKCMNARQVEQNPHSLTQIRSW